jgi:hypothetical protein
VIAGAPFPARWAPDLPSLWVGGLDELFAEARAPYELAKTRLDL